MTAAATVSKTTIADVPNELWEAVGSLPALVTVDIRARKFTLRDLLLLEAGNVVETANSTADQLPTLVNGRQIGMARLEALGPTLGLRITDLV